MWSRCNSTLEALNSQGLQSLEQSRSKGVSHLIDAISYDRKPTAHNIIWTTLDDAQGPESGRSPWGGTTELGLIDHITSMELEKFLKKKFANISSRRISHCLVWIFRTLGLPSIGRSHYLPEYFGIVRQIHAWGQRLRGMEIPHRAVILPSFFHK